MQNMARYVRLGLGLSKIKMQKQKKRNGLLTTRLKRSSLLVFSVLLLVGTVPTVAWVRARAANCTSISDCQQQIANDNSTIAGLQSVATSYQDAINKLQAQINSIQQQIAINQAAQASLQTQIDAAQAKLDQQKAGLAQDLKAMYVSGQMSTVEMLATSKSLSSYVDAATYKTAVQNKIQATLVQVTQLQNQLKGQKAQVEQLLATEQTQEAQVAAAQAQQQQLLAYNQSQQDAYNAEVSQNQQKLASLIAAQRAANGLTAAYYFIRFPGAIQRDPINGSYPYANWPFSMSTAPGCVDGDGPDQWGYCTRQCVSYAAWAVAYSGRSAPYLWGNARDWVDAARSAGIPVYTTPEPGDVAISTAGYWGHAMYVEQVSGNQILVSQYNQQLTGQFSTQWRTWY